MKIGNSTINFVGKEILCSGSAVTIGDDFEFNIEGLIYILKFKNDENNKESRYEIEYNDGKKVIFSMVNCDNALGSGFANPIRFGTVRNKQLFLNLMVYGGEKSRKEISFTWFLGAENGKK